MYKPIRSYTTNSLPADVLWGSFVTHSFLPHGLGLRNPRSTEKDFESSSENPESMAWNPETKTVLALNKWGGWRCVGGVSDVCM